MLIHKRYILLTIVLMIMSALITFVLKKPYLNVSYPPVRTLHNANSLICEEQIIGGIGARETCDEKNTYGWIRAGKEKLSEAARIGNTDKWVSKKAFDIRKINYRNENGIIYIKDKQLLQEIEDKNIERQFKISNENEKYIIAQSFDTNSLATSSATLFLDKSKGLLMLNNTSTSLYCQESFGASSVLYSCQEN